MEEKWKIIPFAKNYEVSTKGRVRKDGELLKKSLDKYGYPRVFISTDSIKRSFPIHRLVGDLFLDRKEEHTQINHKDGDKTNSSIDNLEWCTNKENIVHSFENMLNPNTNPLLVTDLFTKETKRYRSLKYLGKVLNISPNVLICLIKHSDRNPVCSRYTIRIIDENEMFSKSNTKNFGRNIWVYDHLTNETINYPSVTNAAYRTCLRNLTSIKDFRKMDRLGFSVSFDIENIDKTFITPIEEIKENREKYYLTPYVRRDITYYLFDYFKKIEYTFFGIDEIVQFINRNLVPGVPEVDSHIVSNRLGSIRKDNCTSLLRGFGLKSSKTTLPWRSYPEYVIICNKYATWTTMVYRLFINNETRLFLGVTKLRNYLISLFPDNKLFESYSGKEITDNINSLNNPNFYIETLDSLIHSS